MARRADQAGDRISTSPDVGAGGAAGPDPIKRRTGASANFRVSLQNYRAKTLIFQLHKSLGEC